MKPIQELNLILFADYSQFYIEDESADDDLSEQWSTYTCEINLLITNGRIGIGTARNMNVPVILKIFDSKPEFINDQDNIMGQINECDLEVSSGALVISGCTDYLPDAKKIELQKGIYRARIYYANLDTISLDGLSGDDFYEIHLWLTNKNESVKIIKGKHVNN